MTYCFKMLFVSKSDTQEPSVPAGREETLSGLSVRLLLLLHFQHPANARNFIFLALDHLFPFSVLLNFLLWELRMQLNLPPHFLPLRTPLLLVCSLQGCAVILERRAVGVCVPKARPQLSLMVRCLQSHLVFLSPRIPHPASMLSASIASEHMEIRCFILLERLL